MIPNSDDSPKPRKSRSKAARTRFRALLRASPGNASGLFDPLTQEEFDLFIETVSSRWRWAYEEMFKFAMCFESEGVCGRPFWESVCDILKRWESVQAAIDRANGIHPAAGFFSLMRENSQHETSTNHDNPARQEDSPDISPQILETVIISLDYLVKFYAFGVSNLMLRSYSQPGERTRASIPQEVIEQLALRLDIAPRTTKGEWVQKVAEEYGVTTRTVYRHLKDLNR
jgi:hypothetical protein